jgi:hypothetical protein
MHDNRPACPNLQEYWKYLRSRKKYRQRACSKNRAGIPADAFQANPPTMDGPPTMDVLFSSENWGQQGGLLSA